MRNHVATAWNITVAQLVLFLLPVASEAPPHEVISVPRDDMDKHRWQLRFAVIMQNQAAPADSDRLHLEPRNVVAISAPNVPFGHRFERAIPRTTNRDCDRFLGQRPVQIELFPVVLGARFEIRSPRFSM